MNKVGILSITEADLPDRPLYNLIQLPNGDYKLDQLGINYRKSLKEKDIKPCYLIKASEQELWNRYHDQMQFYDCDKNGLLITKLKEKSLIRRRNHV